MKRWVTKWIAFFFPVSGWQDRYFQFRNGKGTWEVPGKPDCPHVLQLPVEWLCVDLDDLPEQTDRDRGFAFKAITCVDTGKAVPAGEGARCARCGVNLHPYAANLVTGFEVPSCRRCRLLL